MVLQPEVSDIGSQYLIYDGVRVHAGVWIGLPSCHLPADNAKAEHVTLSTDFLLAEHLGSLITRGPQALLNRKISEFGSQFS